MADVAAFISRWRTSGASERANYQLFLSELCDVLDVPHPNPASDQNAQNAYVFERTVTLDDGAGRSTSGFIDLYKRDCFILEAKQGSDRPEDDDLVSLGLEVDRRKQGTARRGTRAWSRAMERAKNQALRYARALPKEDGWPPFLIVADVGFCFDLYADFSRQGKSYVPFPDPQRYRIHLEDLADENLRALLRAAWDDPLSLDPSARSARVTRELAEHLARLASSLEKAGHEPGNVAQFLMRSLFSMFAEDVELLPKGAFTGLLMDYREALDVLPKAMRALWQTMDTGGFLVAFKADIAQFNGSLYADAEALPLSQPQLDLLIKAAQADWRDVEPAIFGTLLERALNPRERHKLGAHFTPRAYVERLVMPAVIEPLREEWDAAQAAAAALEAAGDEQAARRELQAFHHRLCSVRVLDPACGSGNFLYVTLEHLKRLEGEVVLALQGYGGQQVLDMTGGFTVSPEQLLGLEVNPRAAAIAEVVLWIGYLQWHFRTFGHARRLDPPILRKYNNIRRQDAVLAYDERVVRTDADGQPVTQWDGHTYRPDPVSGALVPDEAARVPVSDYVNPRPAEWPKAEFIVGNPPFVGSQMMRGSLGTGYTEALRKAYRDTVPGSADFVMFWWQKAAELVRTGASERFGFITTNSLKQTFNRRVLQNHLGAAVPLSLAYAIPDHPWVDSSDGAAVRIGMTVGVAGESTGTLAIVENERAGDGLETEVTLREVRFRIHADLTAGADLASVVPLAANEGISFMGVKLVGSGFVLEEPEAQALGLGRVDELNAVIKPFRNGRDLTASPRNVYVIDLFGFSADDAREQHPEVYQWVRDRVRPEREARRGLSKDADEYAARWWQHAKPRPEMRTALAGLGRYIATSETSKHRFFVFLDGAILPDGALIVVASDDAFHLGVLSSRFHVAWSLAAGGRQGAGNDPRYNSTRTFRPYPFPPATPGQVERIRTLAESMSAHRERQIQRYPELSMTGIYNVLEKMRAGLPLTGSERETHEAGLLTILTELHQELDAAVAEAYGWPADLPDADVLARLAELNRERAAEEKQGHIRWLRPAYQNPAGTQQTALAVDAERSRPADEQKARVPFPKELRAQMQALQRALAHAGRPVTADELARHFQRAPRKQVASLLDTLEALGLVRLTGTTEYAG